MAQVQLNSGISSLDHSSDTYALYDKLYQGMVRANEVDSFPILSDTLVRGANGEIQYDSVTGEPLIDPAKEAQIAQAVADYQDITIKNSAYLMASSIMSVMGGGSGSGGSGSGSGGGGVFVYRGGDSMAGLLAARAGFEAGDDNVKIFETVIQGEQREPWAIVTGNLRVTQDARVDGKVYASNDGIYFNEEQAIYYGNGKLHIECDNILLKGDVEIDGSIELGDFLADDTGLYWDGNKYWHAGNSNKSDVDWSMKDAHAYGDLTVDGNALIAGELKVQGGFEFSYWEKKLLYTEDDVVIDEENDTIAHNPYIKLNSDLAIINSHGIKLSESYIIKGNSGAHPSVSFAAPGMEMRLGDTLSGASTAMVTLQSDLYDTSGTIRIISKNADGNFTNSLSAGHLGIGVMQTYSNTSDDMGVLFKKRIKFGDQNGPSIYEDSQNLTIALPYVMTDGETANAFSIPVKFYCDTTSSPFRDLSKEWSATLHLDTEAEFFCFDEPVEAEYFAIKSELYKTRLIENALFFDDGKFLEGVADGIRHSGNAYFDNDLFSSGGFTSGFAGSGWAILEDHQVGGIHATFDSLTVRKKMRVYELEVQKISVTNGSLWVSDACSGDEVREIV